jgi:hypothetical protein
MRVGIALVYPHTPIKRNLVTNIFKYMAQSVRNRRAFIVSAVFIVLFESLGLTDPHGQRPVAGENRWLRFLQRAHGEYLRRAA